MDKEKILEICNAMVKGNLMETLDIEFVDVDQDGWLDVAVTGISPQGRKSELYMNRNGEFFELNTDYVVEGLSQSDMEWADLDDDSDQDLIITGIDDNNQN